MERNEWCKNLKSISTLPDSWYFSSLSLPMCVGSCVCVCVCVWNKCIRKCDECWWLKMYAIRQNITGIVSVDVHISICQYRSLYLNTYGIVRGLCIRQINPNTKIVLKHAILDLTLACVRTVLVRVDVQFAHSLRQQVQKVHPLLKPKVTFVLPPKPYRITAFSTHVLHTLRQQVKKSTKKYSQKWLLFWYLETPTASSSNVLHPSYTLPWGNTLRSTKSTAKKWLFFFCSASKPLPVFPSSPFKRLV